jgi:DNA-binding NarL/FixJ family response regulator
MNFREEDYKLIAVYPDEENRLKDKLLFEHKNGYKECFHRFDLENPRATIVKPVYAGEWSEKEEKKIIELIQQGKRNIEIARMRDVLQNRTKSAVMARTTYLRKKLRGENE